MADQCPHGNPIDASGLHYVCEGCIGVVLNGRDRYRSPAELWSELEATRERLADKDRQMMAAGDALEQLTKALRREVDLVAELRRQIAKFSKGGSDG